MSYNGWTNRATWLVNVWEFPAQYENRLSDFDSVHDLAETMWEDFEAELESHLSAFDARPMFLDVIQCAQIDWDELARSIWIEEESV